MIDPATTLEGLGLRPRSEEPETARLPGWEGLHHGSLSPDGVHIAALTLDHKSVMRYDLRPHRQPELVKGAAVVSPYWWRDGRSVFYGLTGITPDDQVLALMIRSNSDLYALDVDFP